MYDVKSADLAEGMRKSADYKIIKHDDWLYVFPATADFDHLAENLHGNRWDYWSVLSVDDEGYVQKNRFGPAAENPAW